MSTCFVIQPFDGGKYDKRFEDTLRPAIEEAGLQPYRVDEDPQVEVPIEAIEEGIRDATIVLADITTDNPNVWYELGYSFAADKPVLMVCSEERKERGYPFDIQHRTVVGYRAESASDFENLKSEIKQRIEALLKKGEQLRQIVETDSVAPRQGLSQPELAVLATLAGDAVLPESATSMYSLKHDVVRAGFTAPGAGLGIWRLLKKGFAKTVDKEDADGFKYPAVYLTQTGWDWIDANEEMFVLKKSAPETELDDFDDIPF